MRVSWLCGSRLLLVWVPKGATRVFQKCCLFFSWVMIPLPNPEHMPLSLPFDKHTVSNKWTLLDQQVATVGHFVRNSLQRGKKNTGVVSAFLNGYFSDHEWSDAVLPWVWLLSAGSLKADRNTAQYSYILILRGLTWYIELKPLPFWRLHSLSFSCLSVYSHDICYPKGNQIQRRIFFSLWDLVSLCR